VNASLSSQESLSGQRLRERNQEQFTHCEQPTKLSLEEEELKKEEDSREVLPKSSLKHT
jgi:hypothetical protein